MLGTRTRFHFGVTVTWLGWNLDGSRGKRALMIHKDEIPQGTFWPVHMCYRLHVRRAAFASCKKKTISARAAVSSARTETPNETLRYRNPTHGKEKAAPVARRTLSKSCYVYKRRVKKALLRRVHRRGKIGAALNEMCYVRPFLAMRSNARQGRGIEPFEHVSRGSPNGIGTVRSDKAEEKQAPISGLIM